MTVRCSALVLAGNRPARGGRTPFHGKAFMPVAGVPMLRRVLRALAASGRIAQIAVATDDPNAARTAVESEKTVPVSFVPAAASPSASVLAVLRDFQGPWPLLVTTADHALLRPEMISYFLDHATPNVDAVAGLVDAACVREAFPGASRTFMKFRDGALKGANLFLLSGTSALPLISFWQEGEENRKKPWRLVARVGPLAVIRYLAGVLDLRSALELLGARTGCRVGAVKLPYAEAALDVDDAADMARAEKILTKRMFR